MDKEKNILFNIGCVKNHKENFDYCLEELIKDATSLQEELEKYKFMFQARGDRFTKALTDIKEYIERCGFKYPPYYLNEEATENLLDMVNKALEGNNGKN